MVKIFFEFLSYNLISLLIILFVGKLVTSCFNIKTKNSKFLDIFIELSIGLLVIVLFSSLIATKGSTVFIFVIPLVVCIALAISFIESIFALPSHLISGFTGKTSSVSSSVKKEDAWFDVYLVNPFSKLVDFSLRNRYAVITFFVLLLFGSVFYAKTHTYKICYAKI